MKKRYLNTKAGKAVLAAMTAAALLSGCGQNLSQAEKTAARSETLQAAKLSLCGGSPVPERELSLAADTAFPQMSQAPSADSYTPLNFETQRSFWFSYIDIADMLQGKSESSFRDSVGEAFAAAYNSGFNTVYVHVRPFGDALYDSDYFAPSRYYTGTPGAAPQFDALEIMVEQAHRNGLSIHAWINPLRCEKPENIGADDSFPINKWYNSQEYNGRYVVYDEQSGRLWLDPAYPEVRELIFSGVREICQNYKVDGIHIDDYFYPTTDESFDQEAFLESGRQSLSDFRLENTDLLVMGIYNTVKQCGKDLLFGISPQGNIDNNYKQLYADVKRWASEKGWCDYIVPQVYYGFDNKTQPFEQVVEEWSRLCGENTKLVIGLAFYKIGNEEEFTDTDGIIAKQIECCRKLDNYSGTALYSFKSMFFPDSGHTARVFRELDLAFRALDN